MKYLVWAVAGLIALLLFLPGGGKAHAPTLLELERDTHAKSDLQKRIEGSGLELPEETFCTARKVRPETVETMYKIFLYHRGDLTDAPQRDSATHDVLTTYEFACGGDIIKMANTLRDTDDDVVHKAFVAAMVREGR